jgi:hypothetical protein
LATQRRRRGGEMTDSNKREWFSAISRHIESSKKIELLSEKVEDKEKSKEELKILYEELFEQYDILMQSYKDIRSSMRSGTIIHGIENEDDIDWLRDLGKKDKYTIMEKLEYAWNHYFEASECDDDRDSYDSVCAEMLKILIDFPFFKPDIWCKKEDELPPLYIKGPGIPDWLSDRYREAVYSYIYGFNNAAIAICRSIIEGIIGNRIGEKYNYNEVKFEEMLNFYMNTIKDTEHKQVAWSTKKVRKLANEILHDIKKSATDNSVKEALLITRDFIKSVY